MYLCASTVVGRPIIILDMDTCKITLSHNNDSVDNLRIKESPEVETSTFGHGSRIRDE